MFLVAGSGGATAVTRGLNGNIPPRVDSLTQVPATLVEWHDKPQRTEFNIFASQGDGRRIMQGSTVKVLNRKIDQDILGVISGASSNLGSAQAMTLALATRALAHLDLQDVDTTEEDNMFFVGSPANGKPCGACTGASSGNSEIRCKWSAHLTRRPPTIDFGPLKSANPNHAPADNRNGGTLNDHQEGLD